MERKKANLKDVITPMEFFKLRGQEQAVNQLPLERIKEEKEGGNHQKSDTPS